MRKFQILFALLVAFAAEGFAKSSTGDNRIVNPSFETDEKAFNWKRMESPRRRVEAEDDPRYISRFDGEHVKRGSRSWFMRCENTEGRNIMRFNALAVTPGRPYVFKAYYRIEDADGLRTVWGNYHEHNAAGKTSGYKNLDRFSTETGKWNEFTCSFYASPESVTADVELIFIGKMSVWVDEVSFAEQVEPEPLPVIGGKLPESDLFSLSWLSPLSKAMPCGVDGRLEDGDGAVHLDAARNEAESFQLVLGAKRDLKNVELEVSDFVLERRGTCTASEGGNACIQQNAVKVREVLFVPVSGVSNPGMNRLHPDPVVDYSQGDAAAGSNKVFLVTVKTPADAAAGAYAGTLSLRVSGGEVVRIPVKLRVRDFVLPDTAKLKSYFYFSPSAFLNSYGRYDARPAKEICDDMYRHYRELRLTGNQAVDLPDPEWTMKDGHVVVTDWSAYEAEVERLKREFNFAVFPVPFVGMLGDNQGWFKGGRGTKVTSSGRVVGLGPKETPFGGFFDEPDGQRRVIEALSQFAERTKKRFPDVMFSWYIYDEPSEAVMDVLPKLVKAYADALPEIKFLVVHTLYADQLEHYDIRVATFNPSSINPQVRNFDTSWYYQYPAVITDSEYLRNRFFPWQVYQADGEGVLLWSVAYYGKPNPKRPKLKLVSPWLNPAVAYESAYTTLFYPPRQGKNEGVVSTIRAINIGDGIDDFDYLKLYEEKFGKENLKKLIKNVLPEATNLPSDQAAFLKLRREIAECLERKTVERSARDLDGICPEASFLAAAGERMRWSVRDAENGALIAIDVSGATVTVERDGEAVFETWIESPVEHRRKCLVSLPNGGEVLVNGERAELFSEKLRKGWNHVAVRTFRTMGFCFVEAVDGHLREVENFKYSSTPPLHAFIQRWGDNLVSGENSARLFRDIPVAAGRFYRVRTEPRVDGTCRFVDASGGEYRRLRLSDCTQFYAPPGATYAEIMLDSEAKLRFFEDAEPPAVPVPHPDPLSYSDVTLGAPDDRFQREIDAAAERGGGEVRVPAGVWHVKPLVLKSNVTLHFAKDAVLLASVEPSDYDPQPHRRAFIYAEDAENVGICGEGVIDGRGYAFREQGKNMTGASQPQTLPKLMCFNRCRNVRLEGFTYRRGGAWGCHLRNCDGVVMRRVKCFNHINKTNDGVDIESSNVLIEDCDIDADDDAIAVKSESDPLFAVTNITVRNCRLASMAYPFKIGTGSYGDVRDIRVEDCMFPRTKMNHRFAWSKLVAGITNDISGICGIGIQCVDGGRLENVTVRNVSMEGYGVPLAIRLGRRHEPADGKKTYLRNVLVENVTAVAEGPTASSIVGAKGLEIEDVTLRNLKITLAGGATLADAGTVFPNEKGYPGPNMFKSVLPTSGLFVKDARNVNLENVDFEFSREDERPLTSIVVR